MKTLMALMILVGMLVSVSPTLARTLQVNCDAAIGPLLKRARPGNMIQTTGPCPGAANCDEMISGTIGQALKRAQPGDLIQITGTCHETVTITTDRVTLDGQGTTVIDGGGGSEPVVTIAGVQGVTIRNVTMRNGFNGILAHRGAAVALASVTAKDHADVGILIADNSTARLTDCTTQNNATDGIRANRTSSITFTGNLTSTGNTDDGIAIKHGSSAFFDGTIASVNNNGNEGIRIHNGSAGSAREATIAANQNGLVTGEHGVQVDGTSGFRLNTNTTLEAIGNEGNGIEARRNASIAIFSGASVRVEQNNRHGLQSTGGSSITFSEGTALNANSNAINGLISDRGSLISFSGTALNARSNGSRGVQATETSTITVGAGTVVIESNAKGGVQALRNSLVKMEGTGLSAQIIANTGNGVTVNQNASVVFASGTVIRDNTARGLWFTDGSHGNLTNIMAHDNGAAGIDATDTSLFLTGSTITGNGGADITLFFGTRAELQGNTIGHLPITCDGTVLSRGSTVCP